MSYRRGGGTEINVPHYPAKTGRTKLHVFRGNGDSLVLIKLK